MKNLIGREIFENGQKEYKIIKRTIYAKNIVGE